MVKNEMLEWARKRLNSLSAESTYFSDTDRPVLASLSAAEFNGVADLLSDLGYIVEPIEGIGKWALPDGTRVECKLVRIVEEEARQC